MSVFETLNAVNVNGHSEKKNGLTYLSWAWAWAEVKKAYPDAQYTIYETPEGCFYWTDGRTCWVKTGVTINGLEHIEYLPVMDYRNAAIQLEKVTSTDVNKAIQRSLTNGKTFVNSFGEATKREITTSTYKSSQAKLSKEIMGFVGGEINRKKQTKRRK